MSPANRPRPSRSMVRRGRVRVAMTRDDDRYLTLEDRPPSPGASTRRCSCRSTSTAPNPLARGAMLIRCPDVASDSELVRSAAAESAGRRPAATARSEAFSLISRTAGRDTTPSAHSAAQMVGKSSPRVALRPNPHRFAAFHCLGQRLDDFRAVPGRSKQQFVICVGNVAGFEQHRGGAGAAQDVEIGEAVRVGAKGDPGRGFADHLRGEVGRGGHRVRIGEIGENASDRAVAAAGRRPAVLCSGEARRFRLKLRRTANRQSRRAPAGWARCRRGATRTSPRRGAGRRRPDPPASNSGRHRGSSRRGPGRA